MIEIGHKTLGGGATSLPRQKRRRVAAVQGGAIIAVAGPVFERGAIGHSYACRRGGGQHAALRQLRDWMRPDDWFLKLDVAKFYDSIDHALLHRELQRRFREERLLSLFDYLLASYETAPGRGLPIGALTSQYLGNFYLDGVDHWVNQSCRIPRYLRYMDDMIMLGTRQELRDVRRRLKAVLVDRGVAIKGEGVLNAGRLGVPFLGFTVYPDRMRLNRLGRRRLRRRTREIELSWLTGRLADSELQARGRALYAHAQAGDDVAWRRTVLGFSRLGEPAV